MVFLFFLFFPGLDRLSLFRLAAFTGVSGCVCASVCASVYVHTQLPEGARVSRVCLWIYMYICGYIHIYIYINYVCVATHINACKHTFVNLVLFLSLMVKCLVYNGLQNFGSKVWYNVSAI